MSQPVADLEAEDRRLATENPALLAVPPHLRPSRDSWSRLPLYALAFGHSLREALVAVLSKNVAVRDNSVLGLPYMETRHGACPHVEFVYFCVQFALTASTVVYVTASTIDRSRVSSQVRHLTPRFIHILMQSRCHTGVSTCSFTSFMSSGRTPACARGWIMPCVRPWRP